MNNLGKLIMKIQMRHDFKKNFQRNKVLIILFLISIILCEILIFNRGFFIYRFNNLHEQNYYVSDGALEGFEIINGRLISLNDDPNITLTNINIPVEYLSINCTNSNPDSIGQVFFRGEGEFFTESNSIKYSFSSPEKILKLPELLKVASLRFDLTDTKNDSIYCKELSLNPKIKYDFSYGRLIMYLLISVGLFFGNKRINPFLISIILCEILIFNRDFFIYRFNNLHEQNYYVSDGALEGFEIINGRLISLNDDPNITLTNINIPVEYLSINCTNSNPDSIGQVFFRGEGEFFTESNSIKYSFSSPKKILKLPELLKVASLRFDLTDTKNDSIYCKELSLNPKIKYDFSYGRLIMYLLISVGLFFGYKIIKKKNPLDQKKTITNILFIVLLLVFVIFAAYFALKLKCGIIPDETAHFYMSQHFSTTLGIPPDTDTTLYLGLENMDRKPFLYYWLNGRVLAFLWLIWPAISDWQQLVFLRLTSIFYSVLSIVFCYKLAKEVIKSHWGHLLVVFMLTSSLMFVFLSGGVSYDNFINLCCFAGIYYLVRVFNRKLFYRNSLAWLICIFLGALVKITVLPLALVMGLAWILYIFLHHKQISFHPIWDWKIICLLIIFGALVILNFSIYGINIVKYKALTPACNRILTEDQCNLSQFIDRAKQLNFPEEKITLKEVLKEGKPDPIEYVSDYWIFSMLKRIYGIMGHKAYFPDLIITFYRLFFLWVLCVTIRYWKKPSYTIGSMFTILIFYILLLLWTNYNSELITGFQHVAIQGRYIFPVIGIFYTLIVYYMTQISNSLIRRMTVAFTLILFFIGGPVMVFFNSYSLLETWFI